MNFLGSHEWLRKAHSYFNGGEDFRQHIRQGDLGWCLDALKSKSEEPRSTETTDVERKIIIDLEIAYKRIRRLPSMLTDGGKQSPSFLAEAHLASGGILRFLKPFANAIKELHDRTRPQKCHHSNAHEGNG